MEKTAPTLLLAMFSLFGCFTKKTPPQDIKSWIGTNFPDQLEVLQSNRNFDVMDLISSGKKIAIVADKSDPEVQFTLDWVKPKDKSPDIGLDVTAVKAKLDSCRVDVRHARALFTLLKNKGLQQHSVGVIGTAAYIMVFAEPSPETREQILTALKTTLDARQDQPETKFWVEIMEPAAYHTEFQDIIPLAHWQRPGSWNMDNIIMSLHFEWKKGLSLAPLQHSWMASTNSSRSSTYFDIAYPTALAWAEKHRPKPFYLEPEQGILIELDENDSLVIRLHFPIYDTKPTEGDGSLEKGFVSGVYNPDLKSFTKMKFYTVD